MNEVQLYTIVHFGGDIARPKIGSIVTYVGGRLSTTKDTGSGRGLSTTKAGGPSRHNLFPDSEPEYRGYSEINRRGRDPRSIHLSNEPVLTNVPPSNEPMLTNVPLLIEPEPIIGQTETSAEFRFEPQPKQMRGSFEHAYQLLTSYFAKVRYGVAYINHVESWNNVILKVRDFPIHVFIKELHRICSEMSYTYRKEAEKSQARLTPWATDHCKSRKFVADSLTCRVRRSRHHFQMTSYGIADSVNIKDGTYSCRWWQMMGIPCEHGVRVMGLANVDPTTRASEYYTNNTYKAVYEPIWIPIRGIEQWKILKTDLRIRAPIPTVRASRPRMQRKRREKMSGLVTKLRFCSRCQKNGHNRHSCKLLQIPSDDNTRSIMAPSFTMNTEPPVIPDEDVAISLH
ncbi:hypothetical protein GIB67_012273 [Kingdonia uniflora]|uniref:Zinc finger PMZ-type domain-containing protein n=1 Tax=Kingdonia uniflora TaxID=39325 RepID=A0A7J7LFR4_9MAGN|nr:hypothetical protein GIB67_012273 [Kingdonia uniflora]